MDNRIVVMNDNLKLFWTPAMFAGDFSIVEVTAEPDQILNEAADLDKCEAILEAAIKAGNSTMVDV